MNSAVDDNQTGLKFSCTRGNAWHVYVLLVFLAYPSAIKPQNVYLAIIAQQLFCLCMDKFLKRIPPPGPLLDVVVDIASVLDWIDIPPIVL